MKNPNKKAPVHKAGTTSAPCPPNQQSEIKNQKSRSNPFQTLPEFASLPREQLEYIHEILRNKTYEEAQQEIWSSIGCRISTNRLQRYREKIDLAAALEITDQDTLPAVNQLNDLLAGREPNIAAAGIHLIQQRALALAASPKTSPTLLKDLFRIFTYADRQQDHAHRRKIADQREATRKQSVDDRRAMNEHRKQIDQQKLSLAEQREKTRTRMADIADRAQKHRQQLASDRNATQTQDELTERADAIIAFGREILRQQPCSADSLSASPGIHPPAPNNHPSQQSENKNQQ